MQPPRIRDTIARRVIFWRDTPESSALVPKKSHVAAKHSLVPVLKVDQRWLAWASGITRTPGPPRLTPVIERSVTTMDMYPTTPLPSGTHRRSQSLTVSRLSSFRDGLDEELFGQQATASGEHAHDPSTSANMDKSAGGFTDVSLPFFDTAKGWTRSAIEYFGVRKWWPYALVAAVVVLLINFYVIVYCAVPRSIESAVNKAELLPLAFSLSEVGKSSFQANMAADLVSHAPLGLSAVVWTGAEQRLKIQAAPVVIPGIEDTGKNISQKTKRRLEELDTTKWINPTALQGVDLQDIGTLQLQPFLSKNGPVELSSRISVTNRGAFADGLGALMKGAHTVWLVSGSVTVSLPAFNLQYSSIRIKKVLVLKSEYLFGDTLMMPVSAESAPTMIATSIMGLGVLSPFSPEAEKMVADGFAAKDAVATRTEASLENSGTVSIAALRNSEISVEFENCEIGRMRADNMQFNPGWNDVTLFGYFGGSDERDSRADGDDDKAERAANDTWKGAPADSCTTTERQKSITLFFNSLIQRLISFTPSAPKNFESPPMPPLKIRLQAADTNILTDSLSDHITLPFDFDDLLKRTTQAKSPDLILGTSLQSVGLSTRRQYEYRPSSPTLTIGGGSYDMIEALPESILRSEADRMVLHRLRRLGGPQAREKKQAKKDIRSKRKLQDAEGKVEKKLRRQYYKAIKRKLEGIPTAWAPQTESTDEAPSGFLKRKEGIVNVGNGHGLRIGGIRRDLQNRDTGGNLANLGWSIFNNVNQIVQGALDLASSRRNPNGTYVLAPNTYPKPANKDLTTPVTVEGFTAVAMWHPFDSMCVSGGFVEGFLEARMSANDMFQRLAPLRANLSCTGNVFDEVDTSNSGVIEDGRKMKVGLISGKVDLVEVAFVAELIENGPPGTVLVELVDNILKSEAEQIELQVVITSADVVLDVNQITKLTVQPKFHFSSIERMTIPTLFNEQIMMTLTRVQVPDDSYSEVAIELGVEVVSKLPLIIETDGPLYLDWGVNTNGQPGGPLTVAPFSLKPNERSVITAYVGVYNRALITGVALPLVQQLVTSMQLQVCVEPRSDYSATETYIRTQASGMTNRLVEMVIEAQGKLCLPIPMTADVSKTVADTILPLIKKLTGSFAGGRATSFSEEGRLLGDDDDDWNGKSMIDDDSMQNMYWPDYISEDLRSGYTDERSPLYVYKRNPQFVQQQSPDFGSGSMYFIDEQFHGVKPNLFTL